jgi:LysR family glycine cleavage system transcriptional activator
VSSVPPLNALRAFEAAARTGSFTLAGAELGVTSAAVSQQVKALEDHLGRQLFLRQGNRIRLTDAGLTAYPRLEQIFADLSALAAALSEPRAPHRLTVSVVASLAETWLLPRLAQFRQAHPIGLAVVISEDPVDFMQAGIDIHLTYGTALYPEFHHQPVFATEVVPLCSPGFHAAHPDIAALPESGFIHTDWGRAYASRPTWSAWFARARIPRFPDISLGLTVGWSSLAIAAAREGLGIALAPRALAAADLASGRLVIPHECTLPMDASYCLISPHAYARRKPLRLLADYLSAPA